MALKHPLEVQKNPPIYLCVFFAVLAYLKQGASFVKLGMNKFIYALFEWAFEQPLNIHENPRKKSSYPARASYCV